MDQGKPQAIAQTLVRHSLSSTSHSAMNLSHEGQNQPPAMIPTSGSASSRSISSSHSGQCISAVILAWYWLGRDD